MGETAAPWAGSWEGLRVSQKLMMLGTGDRRGWMGAECGEDRRWLAVCGGGHAGPRSVLLIAPFAFKD